MLELSPYTGRQLGLMPDGWYPTWVIPVQRIEYAHRCLMIGAWDSPGSTWEEADEP